MLKETCKAKFISKAHVQYMAPKQSVTELLLHINNLTEFNFVLRD